MQQFLHDYQDADNADDWPRALALAQQAVARHPGDARAWALRARARDKLHDDAGCDADVAQALALDPHCGPAAAVRANRLGDMGRADEAMALLDTAIAHSPPHAAPHIARGWLHMQAGRTEAALADFHQATQLAPRSARAHAHTAHKLVEMDRAADALPHWQAAADLSPADGEAAYNAGTALFEAGQYEQALIYLDRARALQGEQNAVQMNRAMTLQQLGRHQEAVEEFLSLYRREPDWDWVLRGLGTSCYHLGQLDRAKDYFRQWDELDQDAGALQLGWLLFNDRKNQALIDWVLPRVGGVPLRPEFGQMLAMAHWRLDQDDAALDWAHRAVAADENYHYARGDLANILSASFGRHQEALEHIQTAIALSPEAEFYRRVHGEILERMQAAQARAAAPRGGGWLRRWLGR